MVNIMYAITTATFSVILLADFIYEKNISKGRSEESKPFLTLLMWVLIFCVQDTFWGLFASPYVNSRALLFISSTVFHSSTVLTTFAWMYYVLSYLGPKVAKRKVYMYLEDALVLFQFALLILNLYYPVIFTINENCEYITGPLRPIAFGNQYISYLLTAFSTIICIVKSKGQERKKYVSVLTFVLAPALLGAFQFMYPDGPFYSIGYFVSCCMIHTYIISSDREKADRLLYEKDMKLKEAEIDKQLTISHTDGLTGLYNRLGYEEDLNGALELVSSPDFVYISVDVNGLKKANDSLGHAAGDELIIGAAKCLKRCFGPYGRVYRIGGDEFAVLMEASREELESARTNFDNNIYNWRGELMKKLTLSAGYALRKDYPDVTALELGNIADGRMYEEKRNHYKKNGVDRRGQSSAFNAVCSLYTKILKIDLLHDDFKMIKTDDNEQILEAGFSYKMSEWFKNFADSGLIHSEDYEKYLSIANVNTIKEHFATTDEILRVNYRRNIQGEFKRVIMEIIKAEDYSDDAPSVYLFVKED